MSQLPVPFEVIPRFRERLSTGSALADTSADLALFALLAFMAANIAFLRSEIA